MENKMLSFSKKTNSTIFGAKIYELLNACFFKYYTEIYFLG